MRVIQKKKKKKREVIIYRDENCQDANTEQPGDMLTCFSYQ